MRGDLQIVYPVLLVVMIYRTHRVRVVPDALIVFTPIGVDVDSLGRNTPSFLSRVMAGLKEDHSMFAWANKGEWETVATTEEETRREGDRFRIGFEPLFVDFTKYSAWFMVYSLVEVRGVGMNCF